jgi:hypothetical protein
MIPGLAISLISGPIIWADLRFHQGHPSDASRAKITFGILEEQGKVPPNTTETIDSLLAGDRKALGKLCEIVSADESSKLGVIDCSPLEAGDQSSNTTVAISCNAACWKVIEAAIGWLVT